MKKALLAVAALGFFLYSAPCFAASESHGSSPLYKGKITIGTVVWPGYLALYIAAEKGYFKEAGLDVDVTLSPGLGELSKEYTAGKIQGRANLVFDAVQENLAGFDHKVVLAIDYSNGADAILARQDIQSVPDFKGKRVGYEFGTLEEFVLVTVLTENEMQLSDVIPVNASPEEAVKLLQEGKVDVAVTYEPFSSRGVSSGDFHAVFTSATAPGLITDILTFRTDFIEAHPETVQAILSAYFRGYNFWKTNPEEAQSIIAKRLSDTPEGIAAQLQELKVLDERDNQTAFTFSTGLQSLYGNMRKIGKFIQKQETGMPAPNTDKLIEKKFVKEINAQR